MAPVDPIGSSSATMPRPRRHSGAGRHPLFTLPPDEKPAGLTRGELRSPIAIPASPDLGAGNPDAETKYAGQSSQTFVTTVAQVAGATRQLTGWFVDISV